MKRIIFVCTGNTCRSPMAEALAIKAFKENQINVEISSRGIMVTPSPANENAIKVVKKYNIELARHEAKQFYEEEVDEQTTILTMTMQHKQFLLMKYPNLKNLYTFKEYLQESGDITDPFGQFYEVYADCANDINVLIEKLVKKIKLMEVM